MSWTNDKGYVDMRTATVSSLTTDTSIPPPSIGVSDETPIFTQNRNGPCVAQMPQASQTALLGMNSGHSPAVHSSSSFSPWPEEEQDCSENYFVNAVSWKTSSDIYKMDVEFEPQVLLDKDRMQFLSEYIKSVKDDYVIFSEKALFSNTPIEKVVKFSCPTSGNEMNIRFTNPTNFNDLSKMVQLWLYNQIVEKALCRAGLLRIQGRSYDPTGVHVLKEVGLEVWPGYDTSVRTHQDDTLLMSTKCCFLSLKMQTLLEMIEADFTSSGDKGEVWHAACNKKYEGEAVLTQHTNRIYRIVKIAWDKNPMSTFYHVATGKTMTFVEYFRQEHGVVIQGHNQPMIEVEYDAKQPCEPIFVSYMVPEICNVCGVMSADRKGVKAMNMLNNHTNMDPQREVNSMLKMISLLQRNPSVIDFFKFWKIEIGDEPLPVSTCYLDPETVIGETAKCIIPDTDMATLVKATHLFRPMQFDRWMVVCPRYKTAKEAADKFIDGCGKIGPLWLRVDVEYPRKWSSASPEPAAYVAAIKDALDEYRKKYWTPKLIVVVFDNEDKARYDAVKRLLCLEVPFPCKIMQLSTLINGPGVVRDYTTTVLDAMIQMNCNLGGATWKAQIQQKNCMFVGLDWKEDTEVKGKMVGACVSSYDQNHTQWFSQVLFHEDSAQLRHNIGEFIKGALETYSCCGYNNGHLPDTIVIYRSGYAKSQYTLVQEYEVNGVLEAIRLLGNKRGVPYVPAISFVGMHVNPFTRLYKRVGRGRYDNPTPGTVLDTVVTDMNPHEFLLVSQKVTRGTVTPVSFVIIYDTTHMPFMHQHRMAYQLCYLHYGRREAVRVPAPCKYAQELALLVAQSLHERPQGILQYQLFYM